MKNGKWYEYAITHFICGWAHLAQGLLDITTFGLLFKKAHIPLSFAQWCAKHIYK